MYGANVNIRLACCHCIRVFHRVNAPSSASYAYSESGEFRESFQYTFTYCEAKCNRLYAKRDLIVFVIECEYHLFLSLSGHVCSFREHSEIGYTNKRLNIYNSISNMSLRLMV